MSDDLKRVYEYGGEAAYFFDGTTPMDLFRGEQNSKLSGCRQQRG
jgi:hypothetical protein